MTHDPSVARVGLWPSDGPASLDAAYEVCAKITSQHSKSFYLSSALLPQDKRRAVRAFYAFCRRSDDIVDVVDTGNTLKANGLAPLEHIADISSRLIVNKAAMKMKHARIKVIMERMATAVTA